MTTNFTTKSDLQISFTPPVLLDNIPWDCTVYSNGLFPPTTASSSTILVHINQTDGLDLFEAHIATVVCSNAAGEGEGVPVAYYLPGGQ